MKLCFLVSRKKAKKDPQGDGCAFRSGLSFKATVSFQMEKNGESASEAAWGLPPPSLSCSLNDACCSGGALMWEIAVMFSMWQIIRHANQVEAAVESLITVRVPPQRQLCALCRLPLSPSRPPPPSLPSSLYIHHPPFSCCPCSPRQTDGPEAGALRREQSLWRIGHRGCSLCLAWDSEPSNKNSREFV